MAARKERKKRRASRNEPLGPTYPPGTPVNEATGLPEADGEISVETARRVGFDPTSARKRAQFKRQVERRAGGEKNVKWNADPRLKYLEIVQVHPSAFMTVKQISPHMDDSLDDQSVKAMPTLGHLKAYVKETHWKGDKATYVYEAWDAANPIIGEAEFYFSADLEWAERKEEEMARRGQPPNPQYPPQGGYPGQQYPPQGYYQPPQGYAYPPPGYGQPQTTVVMPHPIQQQAPPPQPPPPTAGNDVFLQYMIQQNEWLRQENSRLQSAPQVAQQPQGADPQQWLAWHNAERQRWEAEQAAKIPVAPPTPPPTPLEQMQSTINMIKAVTSARETIVGVGEPKEEKKKEEDDGFPIAVRQVGPIRIIADKKTGQIIKDPVMSAMFNADNLEDGFNRLFKKAEGLMKDRAADNSAQLDKSLELEKAKQANIREKADLVRSIADGEEKMARARQMVNSMPVQQEQLTPPNPITQVQAEKIAERPTVMAEVQPVKPAYVPPPPPWRVNPQQDFSPAERPVSSSETRPGQVDTPGKIQPEHRNESPEDPEGNGSGPVVSAGEEIPDTEPPPALPEPAPEPTELQTN